MASTSAAVQKTGGDRGRPARPVRRDWQTVRRPNRDRRDGSGPPNRRNGREFQKGRPRRDGRNKETGEERRKRLGPVNKYHPGYPVGWAPPMEKATEKVDEMSMPYHRRRRHLQADAQNFFRSFEVQQLPDRPGLLQTMELAKSYYFPDQTGELVSNRWLRRMYVAHHKFFPPLPKIVSRADSEVARKNERRHALGRLLRQTMVREVILAHRRIEDAELKEGEALRETEMDDADSSHQMVHTAPDEP